jgi:P27 family predicted phage terminase small subunit
MAGRRAIPTAMKELAGNPGKRRLNEHEPQPRRDAPRMPAHLEPAARREWRRLVRILEPMGVLTEAEADLLALYASTYARWVEASRLLQEDGLIVLSGNGTPMRNPLLPLIEQCTRTMTRCMGELGLTPAARARLVAPAAAVDELEELLRE